MIDKTEIVSQIERKRVAANSRLLPETVATFNEYFGLLQELAARAGRSESQMTVQGLLDHIAQKLAEDPDLKRWKARNEGRRRGKKADGPASPEAETAPARADAPAEPFREDGGEAPADPDARERAAAEAHAARTAYPLVKGTSGDR